MFTLIKNSVILENPRLVESLKKLSYTNELKIDYIQLRNLTLFLKEDDGEGQNMQQMLYHCL